MARIWLRLLYNRVMAAVSDRSEWAICQACSNPIELPEVADALLDEFGRAHIRCEKCDAVSMVPYLPPLLGTRREARWNGKPSYAAFVFALVAIGLVLLLLPAVMRIQVEPPPNPLTLT